MIPAAAVGLLLAGAMLACAGGGSEAPREATIATDAEARVTQEAGTIDREALASTVEAGGAVAIVRIVDNEIRLPGTRSERFEASATILLRLHGEIPDTPTIGRYTSGGDLVLLPGRVYAVALQEVPPGSGQLRLVGHVEVGEDDVDGSAARHRAVLDDLGG